MDIFIKSFNRPYYLERCIKSIYRFVSGNFEIHVLDDGTPHKYLDRIIQLFPLVKIHHSPLHSKKAKAIMDHVSNNGRFNMFSIPTNFWAENIARSTDKFLLLEDDIWLIDKINVDEVEAIMQDQKLILIKLAWFGNERLVRGKKKIINKSVEEFKPAIPLLSKFIFLNKFKVASILQRLNLYELKFKSVLPFYSLYTVASAFYDKEYWLYLWQDTQVKVDEGIQLKKAVDWFDKQGSKYAKTIHEITKTSFITSATNQFEGVALDIFRFNHYLNEAWLAGELNALEGFPADLSTDYLATILDRSNDPGCLSSEWTKWISKFQAPYIDLGFRVE